MTNEDSAKVSLMKKKDLFEKYLLIARLAEKYANDKSVVRSMKKLARNECKILQTSRYPMEAADLQESIMVICELRDILGSLAKASALERYRLASGALADFLERLEKKYRETMNAAQAKMTARETLDAAIGKAKSIGEVIGRGVEEIKKTMHDLSSK